MTDQTELLISEYEYCENLYKAKGDDLYGKINELEKQTQFLYLKNVSSILTDQIDSQDGNDDNESEESKTHFVYVQCYDPQQDYFRSEFLSEKNKSKLQWLVINDCNISCSTKILTSNTYKFDNLVGLDFSFNNITDLQAISDLITIAHSPKLLYLDLSRNPIEYQKDLRETILSINPGISVINRKRVTPKDFVPLFTADPKSIKKEIKFGSPQEKRYLGSYQLLSAFKTIPKNRYSINPTVTGLSGISSTVLKTINLSNLSLFYFDFNLFPKAKTIDISDNNLSPENVILSNQINNKLENLFIFGNKNLNDDSFKKNVLNQFPKFKQNHQNLDIYTLMPPIRNNQTVAQRYTFMNIIKQNHLYELKINPTIKFVMKYNQVNPGISFLDTTKHGQYFKSNLINKLRPFYHWESSYTNITTDPPTTEVKTEEGWKSYNEPNEILPITHSLALDEYQPLSNEDFKLIWTSCPLLYKLSVNLAIDSKSTNWIEDFFNGFEFNVMKNLKILTINLNGVKFNNIKHFREIIKLFRFLPNLRILTLKNYTIIKKGSEEVDMVFKYLRYLKFYNDYRNLMPPTPIQFLATEKVANDKHPANHNNSSTLYVKKNDVQNPTNNSPDYSMALPIRRITIDDFTNQPKLSDIKDLKPEELINRHPRCNNINGFKVEQNRIPRLNDENEFETFTNIVNQLLEFFAKFQMFYLYSVVTPVPLFSAMLYFIHSILFTITRYFHFHHFVHTDFMVKYEEPILLILLALFAIILQRSRITFNTFMTLSNAPISVTICIWTLMIIAGGGIFALLEHIDTNYFEKSNIHNLMYLIPYLLYLMILGAIIYYYYKHICIKTSSVKTNNRFLAYQEFNLFKSETAFSILILAIIPLMNCAFDEDYGLYNLIFVAPIIIYVLYQFSKQIHEKCICFIELLDLENNNTHNSNDTVDIYVQKDGDTVLGTNRILLIDKDNKTKVQIRGFFAGAFKYKEDIADMMFHNMVVKYRQSSQMLYKNSRYRGIQKYLSIVDILSRIFAEFTTHYFPEYQFIPPVLYLLYVAIWWPNYNTFDNIIMLATQLSQFCQTVASSTFITSIETQSFLMLSGTVLNFLLICFGTLEDQLSYIWNMFTSFINKYLKPCFCKKRINDQSRNEPLLDNDHLYL